MARINVDRLNQYVNSVGSSRLACRVSTNSRITVSISVRRFKWRGQWPVLSTHSLSFVTIPSSSPVHFQVTLLMSICLNFIGEKAKEKKRVLLYVLKLSSLFLFTTFSIQNFCNIRAVSMARPTTGNAALTISRSLYINHVLFLNKQTKILIGILRCYQLVDICNFGVLSDQLFVCFFFFFSGRIWWQKNWRPTSRKPIAIWAFAGNKLHFFTLTWDFA